MDSLNSAIDLVHIDNINGVVTATATCGSTVVFIVRFIELAQKIR
jgi:hypothetical protein